MTPTSRRLTRTSWRASLLGDAGRRYLMPSGRWINSHLLVCKLITNTLLAPALLWAHKVRNLFQTCPELPTILIMRSLMALVKKLKTLLANYLSNKLEHIWLQLTPRSDPNFKEINMDKLKSFLARRCWKKVTNAIRAWINSPLSVYKRITMTLPALQYCPLGAKTRKYPMHVQSLPTYQDH